ncbi:metal ABC transporter ATP-binding protein [Dolosicoccus paucivorans]|uniref:Manganese ABC transporter ATP-binding protein n=1 Tax=Dolosicoccus paucivorans TaxID=84521 RepID=A0A2N6SLN3_9LACT|nr:metal ABC transporter ATP-binding protein [Dolosicoccus paucivorans]PMB84287.1 manganese ABC transporter ATP-binding protein [Dolosicoccus paucivorans]PMC57953.1 manganese ABC transporter ATP-binding protein [Dolosicoccus paucivorans]
MIEANNLSVSYNKFLALDDVSFKLKTGQLIGIIGPNGAGKSTLMKAMLNILPHSGTTTYDGQHVSQVRKKISYVEQKNNIDHDFPINVLDMVAIGFYRQLGLFKFPTKEQKDQAMEALRQVGLEEFSHRQISELSGGQFQRVLIARVLVQDADYIFLDEPFVGIDAKSEAIIAKILRQMKGDGKTILIVHHDLSKVAEYFDSVILLKQQLIAYGTVEECFTPQYLSEAFGESILTSTQFVGGGALNE